VAGATLVAGLLVPWLVGTAVALAVLRARSPLSAPGAIAWVAGIGYFVGALLLTWWMRLLSWAGVGFGATSIAVPLLACGALAAVWAWRREGAGALPLATWAALRALVDPPELDGTVRLAWRLLLGWVALRFVVLGLEVAWQPLYPWEAWSQWATKARVWYELRRIVPFVAGDAWFAAGGAAYFDAQPDLPPTAPLLQVWSCIALGRWDDSLMNWPWWQTAVALACCIYGALRPLGLSALGALVATYLVASLPLANVHVALAGYPDLFVAAYYTCAVLALLRWTATRDRRDAALAALLALACTEIARPGFAWVLTLLPAVIVALWPRIGQKVAAAGLVAVLLVLATAAQTTLVVSGHPLHLEFAPAWSALAESYFLLGNWNLLWYGVPVAVLLCWRQLASPGLAPLAVVAAAGVLVLFVVLAFPAAAAWLVGPTTMNRATLHFAPVAVVVAALTFQGFATDWTGAAARRGG